jgi:hypothetical protein
MAYVPRRALRKKGASAELLALCVVLVAGVATAWWATSSFVGVDLSSISRLASVLGLTQDGRLAHEVGYSPASEAAGAARPFCQEGQAPTFSAGIAALQARLGPLMGQPIECEHAVSAAGNTTQQTTTGLVAYSSATNTVTFTDGWRHWALTSQGMVDWEGEAADPPTAGNAGGSA